MKIQLIKELKIKNSNVQFVIKKLGSVEFLQDSSFKNLVNKTGYKLEIRISINY